MSEMKYLKFWSKGKKGRALSNFAELSVVIDGREYKTGEHAFHGNKYFTSAQLYDEKKKRKQKLLDYANKFVGDDSEFETALDAKKGGSKTKFTLKDNEIEAWKDNSIETQKIINKYKYETYPEVREVLEKYSYHILLHQDNRAKEDTIWGARIVDGVMIGQNLLGKMWEETRNEMMGGPATPPDVPTQPAEPQAPQAPQAPEAPEAPVEPQAPEAPEAPVEPQAPEAPEAPDDDDDDAPKPPITIQDDIPLDEQLEVTHIELPQVKKTEKQKRKKISIYNKNILEKRIELHISEVGNNLTKIIEDKTKKNMRICAQMMDL